MTDKDRQQSGGKRPSLGSILIVFFLKIFGGFFGLFHGKKTYSNMNSEEQKFFSSMLDGMGQDLKKESAEQDQRGEQ